MFHAEFSSLSWTTPHSGHARSRTPSSEKPDGPDSAPQQEHFLVDGKKRPTFTTVLHSHAALYSTIWTKSDQAVYFVSTMTPTISKVSVQVAGDVPQYTDDLGTITAISFKNGSDTTVTTI